MTEPSTQFVAKGPSGQTVRLSGTWTLSALAARLREFSRTLAEFGADRKVAWDPTGIHLLDSSGALNNLEGAPAVADEDYEP